MSAFSFLTVALGTALARFAERMPVRTEATEAAAGFLLIGGFAAIGCALPVML